MASILAQSSMLAAQNAVPSRSSAFTGKAVRVAGPARVQVVRNTAARAAAMTDRPVWFPGNAAPAHLDGSLAGDFGFDPLSLGAEPATLKWFQQSELVHGRTAMLAVAGILFPSVATKLGGANIPEWYDAGKVYAEAHPEVNQQALLFAELLLCGWAEVKRWQDFKNPGSQGDGSFLGITDGLKGTENGYPGGIFDPFGFSKGSKATYERYKWNEIRNGRLAMVAFVGFVAQHYAYPGKGPIDNLADHLADPYHVTFATNGVSIPLSITYHASSTLAP